MKEGHRNEINANSDVGPWQMFRSLTWLPVSERAARVALWGVNLDAMMLSETGAFFFVERRTSISFLRKDK